MIFVSCLPSRGNGRYFLTNNLNIKSHPSLSNIEYNFLLVLPSSFTALLLLPPAFLMARHFMH